MVEEKGRVCVTGGGGYQASWLIKLLLSRGYMVHATVRNPSDERNAHLKTLEGAAQKLKMFKADLLDYQSICSAIEGCSGVFHVACPVPSSHVNDPQLEVIEPTVRGTSNVLKACSMAKVKRLVFVSSTSTIVYNPKWIKDEMLDESCWSDIEYCKTIEDWYSVAKTEAERLVLEYGERTKMSVVTVCPTLILGPMLQSTVNTSSLYLLKLIKDGIDIFDNMVRDIVDVRDVADALLLTYEKPEANGRYICAPHAMNAQDIMDSLRRIYPHFKFPTSFGSEEMLGNPLSSEKLQKLGWKWRTAEETLVDSVESYIGADLLDKY